MAKELFNVILGHFHSRAPQSCSGNYMHWQLAQKQTQIINWEAEMQVGNTVGTMYQMGGLDFKEVFLLLLFVGFFFSLQYLKILLILV